MKIRKSNLLLADYYFLLVIGLLIFLVSAKSAIKEGIENGSYEAFGADSHVEKFDGPIHHLVFKDCGYNSPQIVLGDENQISYHDYSRNSHSGNFYLVRDTLVVSGYLALQKIQLREKLASVSFENSVGKISADILQRVSRVDFLFNPGDFNTITFEGDTIDTLEVNVFSTSVILQSSGWKKNSEVKDLKVNMSLGELELKPLSDLHFDSVSVFSQNERDRIMAPVNLIQRLSLIEVFDSEQ